MATYADAHAGWEIFRLGDYALTLDEINRELKRLGHSPVSLRTFAHYNKLVRYGYENYIPINQLDVKTLEDPVWDLALRNRYFTWEAALPVRLYVLSDRGARSVKGTANRLSEAVVSIRVSRAAGISTADFRKGSPVLIHFLRRGGQRFAQVESVSEQLRTGVITLRLSFGTYQAIEPVLGRRPLPLTNFRFRVVPVEEEIYLTRLVQQVYWLFQAIESARNIGEEVLASIDPKHRYALSAPRVLRLRAESPLEVVIGIALAVGLIVDATIGRYLKHRQTYWEGSKARQETKALQWESEQRKALNNITTEEVVNGIADVLARSLSLEGVSVSIDLSRMDRDRVEGIVRKQFLKSVQELAENAAEITVQDDEAPEQSEK